MSPSLIWRPIYGTGGQTIVWRAVCGKSARTVPWRAVDRPFTVFIWKEFPMALCWQMFYCGPLARFLFRHIFRRGKQWAYYKQVILYKSPVNKISGIKCLTTIWILYTRYTWSVYFCRERFILPQKMKRIAKKWLRNWLKWTVWERNIVQDVRQFRHKREIRYNKK